MNIRKKVYDIVYSAFEDGEYIDRAYHEAVGTLSGSDAQLIKRLAYGTNERGVTLEAIINKYSKIPCIRLDADVRILLYMAVYEILYMASIPAYATVNEIVELAKQINSREGYINAVLRSLISDIDAGKDVFISLKPNELYGLPTELWELIKNAYGQKTTVKIAKGFYERQGELSLRIDTSRISVEEYINRLNNDGIKSRKGRYFDEAVIVYEVSDVKSLYGYEDGLFYVMDEASMLPVAVSGIKSGDTVVDVCAAPGGKTITALMRMHGKGMVSARDISEGKLKRLRENVERYPYDNIDIKLFDGTRQDPKWKEKADVLLLDVPCTGIGIIGKKSDLRYSAVNKAVDIDILQKAIVRASLPMLKKGGVLIYSTCTINPVENDEMADMIENELGLRSESLDPYLPESLKSRQTAAGRLTVLPGIYDMDGFFVSRFRK